MLHLLKSGSPPLSTLELAIFNPKKEDRLAMRSLSGLIIVALVGGVTLFTSPEAAMSQAEPQASGDPSVYKAQLRQFVSLSRRNLRDIQALPEDDSAPLPPQLLQNCSAAYHLIRAARHGMEFARERRRVQDPVFELAFKRVDDAWGLARMPIDGRDMVRNHFVSQATTSLTAAIRIVDQALMMLP